MTREEMLKEIYEKVADKTLKPGCKVIAQYSTFQKEMIIFTYFGKTPDGRDYLNGYFFDKEGIRSDINTFHKIAKIIGNDIMIGDVLDYFWKTADLINGREFILEEIVHFKYKNLREKIDNQSLDCIEYVFNLISDKSDND